MIHSHYFDLKVGERYGRFNELITRVVQLPSTAPKPSWFQPQSREGHLGICEGPDAVYIELAIDEDARDADHAFSEVEEASDHIVQIALF